MPLLTDSSLALGIWAGRARRLMILLQRLQLLQELLLRQEKEQLLQKQLLMLELLLLQELLLPGLPLPDLPSWNLLSRLVSRLVRIWLGSVGTILCKIFGTVP